MALQQQFSAPPRGLVAAGATNAGAGWPQYGLLAPLNSETGATLQRLVRQLAEALEALRHLAGLIASEDARPSRRSLQRWLQPNARQAEQAMHELRGLRLVKSPALTDLSQCLTVLVLAADMLVQGQLSGSDRQEFYELLQRNTGGALDALHTLRAQCGLAQ